MNKFNAFILVSAMSFFAGLVSASTLGVGDPIPKTEQVISYLNQALNQEQAY
ncbi:hypothetical protein [Polynucleobacter sp. MWH-Creno-3A4]|nr:hypothetical protein [Polynucleobacter sp. MWH-Creno-3A4]